MTVFILESGDCDHENHLCYGVFSTREKADQWARATLDDRTYDKSRIREYVVDVPMENPILP
jgi:hypothetical protein